MKKGEELRYVPVPQQKQTMRLEDALPLTYLADSLFNLH